MRNATGKGNDVRKVLTYYRVNNGITAPFRVLCDASILHLAPTRHIHLKVALPKLLGAPCVPLVTRCVLEELRQKARAANRQGDDDDNDQDENDNLQAYQAAALYAKRCAREPCVRGGKCKTSQQCIMALIERGNSTKILLATGDKSVFLNTHNNICQFPIITISNQTRLILRKPSSQSIENQLVSQSQQPASTLSKRDVKFLEEIDEDEAAKRKRHSLKLRPPIRKRKRAKGPNPLSVKKKKKQNMPNKPTTTTTNNNNNSNSNNSALPTAAPAEEGAKKEGGGRKRRKRNKAAGKTD